MSSSNSVTSRDDNVDANNNITRLRHGDFGSQLQSQSPRSANSTLVTSSSNSTSSEPSYTFSSSRQNSTAKQQQHNNANNHLHVKLSSSGIGLVLWALLVLLLVITLSSSTNAVRPSRSFPNNNLNTNNSNNGFFVQIPYSSPPTVRPPPYTIADQKCPAINVRENWIDTLCGDLNSGFVPKNPLGHKFSDGGSYPFETIKNKTLEFFRRALPILKNDKSLPKVARYATNEFQPPIPVPQSHYRIKRGLATRSNPDLSAILDSYLFDTPPRTNNRRRRQGPVGNRFCDNALHYHNRLCKLYNAMWGKAPHAYQNPRDSMENRYYHPTQGKNQFAYHHARPGHPEIVPAASEPSKTGKKINNPLDRNPVSGDMPPTACASSAEYLTPVFARNHEGAWRYVVQIPKEGYFTQTVEVTKCLHSECNYMEGSCRTSPRWQSLLVAEMFYPDTAFPTTPKAKNPTDRPSIGEFSKYQEFLNRKASSEKANAKSNEIISSAETSTDSPTVQPPSHCDGTDEIGCYQIRLFYDWFLIPGSCKCWKRQFDFRPRPHHH